MIVKNFINWLTPVISKYIRGWSGNDDLEPLSPCELEFLKEPFDSIKKFLLVYTDTMIFYGYSVLFSCALPAAPFFCFVYKILGKKTFYF